MTAKMTDRAYRELRRAIVKHEIRPGERLDAERVGTSLGCSRAPVVEALNLLRAEGLVVSRRRVGTFASEIGREQIEEVFDAREMIEQWVAPIIIHNVSDRQIDALKEILHAAAELLDPPTPGEFDYGRFMELDETFHIGIIRLSERKRYQVWFDELAAHMQRARHLYHGNALKRSIEGQREHTNILAALGRRDVAELRKKMLNHTRRSRVSAAQILAAQ